MNNEQYASDVNRIINGQDIIRLKLVFTKTFDTYVVIKTAEH